MTVLKSLIKKKKIDIETLSKKYAETLDVTKVADKFGLEPIDVYKILLSIKEDRVDVKEIDLSGLQFLEKFGDVDDFKKNLFKVIKKKGMKKKGWRDLKNLLIFEDWVSGLNQNQIADKYDINQTLVWKALNTIRSHPTVLEAIDYRRRWHPKAMEARWDKVSREDRYSGSRDMYLKVKKLEYEIRKELPEIKALKLDEKIAKKLGVVQGYVQQARTVSKSFYFTKEAEDKQIQVRRLHELLVRDERYAEKSLKERDAIIAKILDRGVPKVAKARRGLKIKPKPPAKKCADEITFADWHAEAKKLLVTASKDPRAFREWVNARPEVGLKEVVDLICEWYYERMLKKPSVNFLCAKVKELLGVVVNEKEIERILKLIGVRLK